MQRLSQSFVRGLLVFLPIAAALGILWSILVALDGWLGMPVPGLGLLVTVVFLSLLGLFAATGAGKRSVDWLERTFEKLPVVRTIYSPIRDLLHALLGDRKSFDKPILVDLTEDGSVRAFGFVTCETFDDPQLDGWVAVYLPQSYNFAGNVILVRRERVRYLDADGAAFMAFIVSGGVAEMSASRTVAVDISAFRSKG
ncbi:MAG: DUF502 domain-containing protein [Polyangiales bacterium]